MNCPKCKAPGMCICAPWPPRQTLAAVLYEIEQEVAAAEAKWPSMNSAHEAYAVLLEEVDELKAHVWTNQRRRDMRAMRTEAIQVAAMAVRFIRDVCDRETADMAIAMKRAP